VGAVCQTGLPPRCMVQRSMLTSNPATSTSSHSAQIDCIPAGWIKQSGRLTPSRRPSGRILANRSYSALGRRTCQRPRVFSSPPKLGVTGVGRAARSTQTVRVPASPCRKAMFPAAVGSDSLTERAFGVTLNVGNDPMRHRRGRGSLIRTRAGFGWLACGGIGGRRLSGSAQPKDRARSGLGGHGQNA